MGDEQEDIDDDDLALEDAMDDALAAAGGGEPADSSKASFQFRDAFRGRGYEVPDEIDDNGLFENIEKWAARASLIPDDVDADKLPTMLQAAREFEQHRGEFEQWRASQSQQPAPQQQFVPQQQPQLTAGREAQAAKAAGYTAADIAEAKQFCAFDNASGMWVPKHPFHGEAAKALNEVSMRAQRNMEEFGIDPDGYVQSRAVSAVEKRVNELLEERLGKIMPDIEAFRQLQAQQVQERFLAPIATELYNLDANGAVTARTPKGDVFEQAYNQAPQGLSELQRLEYARNAADAWSLHNPQQKQQQPSGFMLKKAAAQQPNAKAPAKESSDNQDVPASAGDKKRRFVDRLRQRGGDGRFQSKDQSGTVRTAQHSGQNQSSKRQSARDIYAGLKSGEIPMDDE